MLACSGSEVSYYAGNVPANSICEWTVSGAASYTTTNQGNTLVVRWSENASSCNISLQVTCPDNSVCLAEACVEIIEKPAAGIISNPAETEIFNSVQHLYVCDGQSIDFFSNSTGSADAPIVGYYWDDGRHTWSTEAITITASYAVYGDQLRLHHRAINECGCYDDATYIVHISGRPKMEVDCYGTICDGATVTYASINNSNCNNYLWSARGGEIVSGQSTNSVVVNWNNVDAGGYGYLAVDNRRCDPNACPFLTYLPIPVVVDSVDISGPDTVCIGEVAIFEVPLWGSTSYSWSVRPSSGVTQYNELAPHRYPLLFPQAGTYTVKLSYRNDFLECSGISREKTIVVKKAFNILADDQACAGEEVRFKADVESVAFQWRVYNSNMSLIHVYNGESLDYTFQTPGSYTVTAYSDLFCSVVRKAIAINGLPPSPNPDVSEWESRVCRGIGYVYEARQEPPYYLHWESCGTPQMFDANEFNVSFNSSVCDIRLMNVDQVTGCMSEPFIFDLEEFVPQAIRLNNLVLCANSEGRVQIPIEDNVLHEWSSLSTSMLSIGGDRYSSSVMLQANNAAGTANIRLRRTYCNTFIENTIPVSIVPGLEPVIDYPDSICEGEGYNLQSANTGNTILGTWTWEIEGRTYTTHNATHTSHHHRFNNSGTVTVKLSFTGEGCSNVYESVVSVNVLPAPDVSISFVENAIGATVFVSDQSATNTYLWSEGGQTGNSITVSEPYESYTCTVTGSNGCTVSETVGGGTIPPPCDDDDINGVISAGINCGSASFSYSSEATGNTLKMWDIMSNSSAPDIVTGGAYSSSASAVFTNAGTYTVLVDELFGCIHRASLTFNVPVIPRMNVIHECPNNNNIRLQLQNTSDFVTGLTITEVWRINNVVVTPDAEGYVTVPSGINTIRLSIAYSSGGSARTCEIEEVFNHTRSFADFTTEPSVYCENTPIQFTDNSGTAVSWNWSFNNIAQNKSQNPMQTFQSSGYVNISLQIQDHLGCNSTTSRVINVGANRLDGDLLAAGSYCSGEEWPVSFSYRYGNQSNVNYYWHPINDTTTDPANILTRTGSYHVFLDQPSTGCQYRSPFLNIRFENSPVAFVSGNDAFCYDDNIKLYGNTGNFTYKWTNLTSNRIIASTANLDIPAEDLGVGTHRLRLDVMNGLCNTYLERTVVVHEQAPEAAIRFGDNMCLHNPPVDLTSSDSRMLYWSTGTYGTSTNAYAFGNHSAYYLDNNGCKSKYSYIYVPKNPDFDELLTGCFKFCQYTDFPKYLTPPVGSFDYWRWIYDGQNTISEGRGIISTLEVAGPGVYNLNVKYADNNCSASSPDLVIEDDCENVNRECEIRMELISAHCIGAKNCIPRATIVFEIINESALYDAEIRNVIVTNGTTEDYALRNLIGRIIGSQRSFVAEMPVDITSILSDYISITIEFFQAGVVCKKEILIDLEAIRDECTNYDCDVRLLSYVPVERLSSLDMLYYEYKIYIGQNRSGIEVHSNDFTTSIEPDNYNNNDGVIYGTFSISPARMREIVTTGGELCFIVKSCSEDGGSMCIREVCFTPEFNECITKVTLKDVVCVIRDCMPGFEYIIRVDNLGGSYLNLMEIASDSSVLQILEQPEMPVEIAPYDSRVFHIVAYADISEMYTELELLFVNEHDVYCNNHVYLPIATVVYQCPEKECESRVLDMTFNSNLSVPGYLYMDFIIQADRGADDARVSASYGSVISSLYNPETGIITGILELTPEEYYLILRDEICFDITLCFEDFLCKSEACWIISGNGESCDLITYKLETMCGIDSLGIFVEVAIRIHNNGDFPATLVNIGLSEGTVYYIEDYPVIAPHGYSSLVVFRFRPASLFTQDIDIYYMLEVNGYLCVVQREMNLQEAIEECILDGPLKCRHHEVVPEVSYDNHIYINFNFETLPDGEIIEVYSPDVEVAYYSYDPRGTIDIGAYFSAEEIAALISGGNRAVCFEVVILRDYRIYRAQRCCELELKICDLKVEVNHIKCAVIDNVLYIELRDLNIRNNTTMRHTLNNIISTGLVPVSISPSLPYTLDAGEEQYFDILLRVENPEIEHPGILLSFDYEHGNCFVPIDINVRDVLQECVRDCGYFVKEHLEVNEHYFDDDHRSYNFALVFTDSRIADVQVYVDGTHGDAVEVTNGSYSLSENIYRGTLIVREDYRGRMCIFYYITDINGDVCRKVICMDQLNIRSVQFADSGNGGMEGTAAGSITLYPNPATNMCTISIDKESLSEVVISDIYGREIARHENVEFSVSELAPGSYIVSVYTVSNEIKHLKLLKQ